VETVASVPHNDPSPGRVAPSEPIRAPANARASFRPKLKVGHPRDRQEQEADRVADAVLRRDMPAGAATQIDVRARKSTKAAASEGVVDDETEDRLRRSAGHGAPMPQAVRTWVEPRLQSDFGDVRLHTDAEAAQLNRKLDARAFAHGRDLYFAAGAYDPYSHEGRRLLAHELTHVVQQRGEGAAPRLQRQEGTETASATRAAPADVGEEPTFWERLREALMSDPTWLASQARDTVREIEAIFSDMEPGDRFFDRLHDVYWGFGALILELRRMPAGEKTTEAQRRRANELARRWSEIQDDMAAHHERQVRRDLEQARRAAREFRVELLYAYRDVYAAGDEPEDVEVGSGSLKTLAEKTKDLLKSINEADANISGRSVTPLIPVLDNTLSVVNLIGGWKVTSGLAAESESDIAALQNAWSLSTTVLGLAGFGKFLPLFNHIGPLLDGIAKGWGRVVGHLQEKNRRWWQAREIMGEELPHCDAMPGGCAVFTYMKNVFAASGPLPGRPPEAVVDFFDENRELFSKAATEVMGKSWAEVPTESSWIFWTEVDPGELNRWVYHNRDMAWRLIYGRGMEPPD